jgi:hypothetical protein
MQWICTYQNDLKIVRLVPASHAQQWPQGVASSLQGLAKHGVSCIPEYPIWAHWQSQCQSTKQTFIHNNGDNLGSMQAVWAGCVDCACATYTSTV